MSVDVRVGLNPEQRAAVEHGDGPILVLAGAGTGKTRVLVHRIAHLVETGAAPWQILAVTFTNKAAGEMRERLGQLLGDRARGMWIGTFHATCARLLRTWSERVGLSKGFVILDDDDQQKLITRLLKDAGKDDQITARSLSIRFDRAKNEGQDPVAVKRGDYVDDLVAEIYPRYRDQLLRENAVDFNDLLLHVLTLAGDPDVGPILATQFRHVLVDEFQDTNRVQYALVRHLASATRNLTVVGDDDQSIYRWRGAEPRNILDFDRDFPDAKVVKLEQNYRSTAVILDAANAIIAHNHDRHGKNLWTERTGGDLLAYHCASDDRSEALHVASGIRAMIDDGNVSPRDVAILYRTNAQSRPLEEQLLRFGFRPKVIGGVGFYERKEVKDAIAYLRLCANPAADSAFERVVNVPPRGIGETTVDKIRGHARAANLSMLRAAREVARGDAGGVAAAARKKLAGFVDVIAGLVDVVAAGASVAELLIQTVERSGLRARLEADGSSEAEERLRFLSELVNVASDYDDEVGDDGTLDGFLERTALTSGADDDTDAEVIRMMTIHMAKGLEFPVVYVTGLEDGLFPSLRERDGVSEAEGLEEERRLAYVAVTRARNRLFLTSARVRRVWGKDTAQAPSRFLDDLPPRLVAGALRPPVTRPVVARPVAWPVAPPAPKRPVRPAWDEHDQRSHDDDVPTYQLDDDRGGRADPYQTGTSVSHASFGRGRVIEARGQGPARTIVVDFPTVGRKTIQARFLAPG
jgi:DNA helicase-2/ATP-dependent DNA helicase PcrA